ncbi:UDP-glucose 4-epimerase GalE [Rickettsiella massiliensis]|uniref:UDP-glucose 4-epimerase GalE n=1 Tax=Rickettsiella massiliensis TaxID=676517 RepID=UPI00029ABE5C|nr:UDP-glucose 4-epimerase GalE [Rickettsiella massiliensis]
MANILVTGGCGYIGSHVVSLLNEKKHQQVIIDNFSTGNRKNITPGVEYLEEDIGNVKFIDYILRKYNFEIIIHLAAKTSVEESIKHPDLYHQENLINTISLINTAQKYNVKNFIFASTAAVYCNNNDYKIDEDGYINPISPYGKSKYKAELYLYEFCQKNYINCIIFRYFNVAGQHKKYTSYFNPPQKNTLIQKSIINLLSGYPFIINGNDYDTQDGTCVRDYVHIMDVANAHINAINCLERSTKLISDRFNIGSGVGNSVFDIYKKMSHLVSTDINYSIGPRRKGDIVFSVANTKRIIEKLGWKSMYGDNPIDQILRSEFLSHKYLFPNSKIGLIDEK